MPIRASSCDTSAWRSALRRQSGPDTAAPTVLGRVGMLNEIDVRAQWIGDEPGHPGLRLTQAVQCFTSSNHSCCGGDGSRPARGGMSSPTQAIARRRSNAARRSIASVGNPDVWSAASHVFQHSEIRAFSREYAATEVPPAWALNAARQTAMATAGPNPTTSSPRAASAQPAALGSAYRIVTVS